jgi:choline dehydrogenase-like flavoprotein
MAASKFVVVGSGGGGATIAWLLGKAGHQVTLLEQGPDLFRAEFKKPPGKGDPDGFNRAPHDEYKYRAAKPDPKRRLRGDYNTFRRSPGDVAKPFKNGWTGTLLGGGGAIWGTWAYRALPVDFALATVFKNLNSNSLDELNGKNGSGGWGYSITDWPITYSDMEPFFNVAEALLGVSGDRAGMEKSISESAWYKKFSTEQWFVNKFPASMWKSAFNYPCTEYQRTPVGQFIFEGMYDAGMRPCSLPAAIIPPGVSTYETKPALLGAIATSGLDGVWKDAGEKIWSDRVRQACNMCGYCGEFLCWGGARAIAVNGKPQVPGAPKGGPHSTVIQEMADMKNVDIVCDAKVYEVVADGNRAKGVRYLNISQPETPKLCELSADYVILSCGAVQSARLLFMSGPPCGLGNSSDHLGRHVTFHLFGMAAKAVLKPRFQGMLRSELGFTGNVTSFERYFVQDKTTGKWFKAGTLTSTAKKNPLENALEKIERAKEPDEFFRLGDKLDEYNRTVEVRLTGDDLPMTNNRVDLDPAQVDEYGFPVARITRDVGMHEWLMYGQMAPELSRIFDKNKDAVVSVKVSPHIADLVGDHQMGTCRMGDDPKHSVVNKWCSLYDAKNVFVVDSSFMPTGLGLNPMVTVVANALRVGTHIVAKLAAGLDPALD